MSFGQGIKYIKANLSKEDFGYVLGVNKDKVLLDFQNPIAAWFFIPRQGH